MKQNLMRLSLPLLLLTLLFTASCKKNEGSDSNNSSQIQPEEYPGLMASAGTITDDEQRSGGVYKATLIGSSGSVKLALNGGLKAAHVIFEKEERYLTTTDLANWSSGQAVTNATFTSGNWKLVFSVNANGSNPQILATIPGHTVTATTLKETTNVKLFTYEGTFIANNQSGALNFIIKGDTSVTGLLKTTDAIIIPLKGSILNGQLNLNASNNKDIIKAIGTVANGNASGTFTDTAKDSSYVVTGTWAAKKVL